jgi:hypothetical protein
MSWGYGFPEGAGRDWQATYRPRGNQELGMRVQRRFETHAWRSVLEWIKL